MLKYVYLAMIGIALAALAYFWFFTGALAWLNLPFWALIGAYVGVKNENSCMALSPAGVVGFFIVFTYSVIGYAGSQPILEVLLPFAVLALAGYAGMALAGIAGKFIKRKVIQNRIL